MHGRTLAAEADDVVGRATFAWLPGGYFLEQRIKLSFAVCEVAGLEVIAYDPAMDTFPSTDYPSMAEVPIPYRWTIDRGSLAIVTDVPGATFHGRWSEDGKTFAGQWRPNPGRENDPGNGAYDVPGARAADHG